MVKTPTPTTVTEDLAAFVAQVAAIYRQQQRVAEDARLALAAAIREAASKGVRQVDIIRASGYTREQVRKIVRAGE